MSEITFPYEVTFDEPIDVSNYNGHGGIASGALVLSHENNHYVFKLVGVDCCADSTFGAEAQTTTTVENAKDDIALAIDL